MGILDIIGDNFSNAQNYVTKITNIIYTFEEYWQFIPTDLKVRLKDDLVNDIDSAIEHLQTARASLVA